MNQKNGHPWVPALGTGVAAGQVVELCTSWRGATRPAEQRESQCQDDVFAEDLTLQPVLHPDGDGINVAYGVVERDQELE